MQIYLCLSKKILSLPKIKTSQEYGNNEAVEEEQRVAVWRYRDDSPLDTKTTDDLVFLRKKNNFQEILKSF